MDLSGLSTDYSNLTRALPRGSVRFDTGPSCKQAEVEVTTFQIRDDIGLTDYMKTVAFARNGQMDPMAT